MDSRAELQRLPSPTHPLSLNLPLLICRPQARFGAVNVLMIAMKCSQRLCSENAFDGFSSRTLAGMARNFLAPSTQFWTVYCTYPFVSRQRVRHTARGDWYLERGILSEVSDTGVKPTDNKRSEIRDNTRSSVTAVIAPLGQHSPREIS